MSDKKKIVSPCISICKTDPITEYCYGCARTIEEKNYGKMKRQRMNGRQKT